MDVMYHPPGRRTLLISSELLCQFFATGDHPAYRVTRDGLPGDAHVVEAQWDGARGMVVVTVASAAWETPEGAIGPLISPQSEPIA
jgi:hypothetical protein